jgi:hypothetical protein
MSNERTPDSPETKDPAFQLEPETSRTPRDMESREQAQHDDTWLPSSALPVPAPQDGWRFRWIRVSMVGNSDATNVSKKFREGWVPVKAADHKELMLTSDVDSRYSDGLEVGGLLLCKMPQEKADARAEYHRKLSNSQLEAVDNSYMKESDPRMPVLAPDRQTRTSFGKG